jgi:hypothetical protein
MVGSPSRPTAITGTCTAFFTATAKWRKVASGMLIGGTICADGSDDGGRR